MKDPSPYDDGFYEELGRGDKKAFRKLFSKEYRGIDEDRAKKSYINAFEASDEPEFYLFRDVVNAFSSNRAAPGSNSGFETTIVNPLYEFGEPSIDLLLAKRQPTGVHLCLVSCDVGGENYNSWRESLNNACELMTDDEIVDHLKSHIHCDELDVRSIQYITLTRDIDLIDANVEVLRVGIDTDHYAIWKLIESDTPNEDSEDDREIRYHDGRIIVPSLESVAREGIDPTLAENDNIRFNLTSHPIFPLGEVCLDVYLDNLGGVEEPKEFTTEHFKRSYKDKVHTGEGRDSMEEILEENIEKLLELAMDDDILAEAKEREDRDFRIMWGSDDPGEIKTMIRDKFFTGKVPEETGQIAYELAREKFEPGEHSLDDF